MIKYPDLPAHKQVPQLSRFQVPLSFSVLYSLYSLKMACANPANQPLYEVLMKKAASYPANQPYKARAYKRGAQSISNCPFDLRTKERPEDIFYIGPRIAKFIKDFFNSTPTGSFLGMPPIQRQIALGGGAVMPKCKVPANQPIYEALMKKRDSYPSSATQPVKELYSNAAKAKACRKAAEAVLACDWDIAQNTDNIRTLCGESLATFIIDHINSTKAAQAPATLAALKLLTPKKVVEAAQQSATGGSRVETEEKETAIIPTCRRITVQMLIDALQAAVKKDPIVAAKEVTPYSYDGGNNLGPYEVTISGDTVFINHGRKNSY